MELPPPFELVSEVPQGRYPLCSFYTVDDGRGYEEEAREWTASFRGFSTVLARAKGPATWREACYLKPQYLLALARELRGRYDALTWIDIDARVVDTAPLQVAAVCARGDVWVRRRVREDGKPELFAGCLIINLREPRIDRVLKFLSAWVASLSNQWSDQATLEETLVAHEVMGLDVRYLKPELAWIFDLDARRFPHIEASRDPIEEHRGPSVIHYQASRRRKGGLQQRELPFK